jgi:hypothetical protein
MTSDSNHPKNIGKASQILLLGMEEVMGEKPINELLNFCGLPPLQRGRQPHQLDNCLSHENVTAIQTALMRQYGMRSARGLAQRAGRESFKYGLREFGQETGLLDMKYRLLPTSAKLRTGLTSIAELIKASASIQIKIEENKQQYVWRMESCPFCWHEPSGAISCPTLTGLLQEFLYWASGGKHYQVSDEKACCANLPAGCSVAIEKCAFE